MDQLLRAQIPSLGLTCILPCSYITAACLHLSPLSPQAQLCWATFWVQRAGAEWLRLKAINKWVMKNWGDFFFFDVSIFHHPFPLPCLEAGLSVNLKFPGWGRLWSASSQCLVIWCHNAGIAGTCSHIPSYEDAGNLNPGPYAYRKSTPSQWAISPALHVSFNKLSGDTPWDWNILLGHTYRRGKSEDWKR